MTAEILRVMLAVCVIAMYVLAMLYLRRRKLTLGQFIAWGLLALFIPVLGPFLILLYRPGESARSRLSPPPKPEYTER